MPATVIKDEFEQCGRFCQVLRNIKIPISTVHIVNIAHIWKLPINLFNITSFNPTEKSLLQVTIVFLSLISINES